MLGGKKPFALNRAHKLAMGMEKSYVYICADITEPHTVSFDEAKKSAKVHEE